MTQLAIPTEFQDLPNYDIRIPGKEQKNKQTDSDDQQGVISAEMDSIERIDPRTPQNLIDKTHIRNITGFMEVVDAVPTEPPRTFWEQIKIYENGATKRLYVYNYVAKAWRYTALT